MRTFRSPQAVTLPKLPLTLVALLVYGAGCAPAAPGRVVEVDDGQALLQAIGAGPLAISRSMTSNGIAQNGIAQNGIAQNGIAQNGIAQNGLSSTAFTGWFNGDPGISNIFMRYAYKCAAPAGRTLTWTNPATDVTYAWHGLLGLAPNWAAGEPATLEDQQVVSACLAALSNKYGVHVTLAVEGRTATGVPLEFTPEELATFSVREGCFFGNLFAGEGFFVGSDSVSWSSGNSSVRACALDDQQQPGVSTMCPPLNFVGRCETVCTADESRTFYERCTWNGVTYKPVNTRLQPSDVYACGDGVCQFTEECGSGSGWNACEADCGTCQ